MKIIEDAPLPIYTWALDLEEGALEQARNCAALPCAYHHVAIQADGHQGYGVPIGAVLALDGAVSPYAVGNDIGCGVMLVPTTLLAEDILGPLPTRSGAPGPIARDDLMGWVGNDIPAGMASHRDPVNDAESADCLERAMEALTMASELTGVRLSTSQSPNEDKATKELDQEAYLERGLRQVGTLGSGNHFIELLRDSEDQVWVMLHSGSRGTGMVVCNNFHRMALKFCREAGFSLPDDGLAFLPVDGEAHWPQVGGWYLVALEATLRYAEINRQHMMESVARIFERRFPNSFVWDAAINIHHNDATVERHFGKTVMVHRKGAVKADFGAPTVTPGSMGTGSYLGAGMGNEDSFKSCSHGAGRRMGRKVAERELKLDQELAAIAAIGSKLYARNIGAVHDEMPGAYKDLDEVMANQSDLVETVEHFLPLATYKGSDPGRKKKGATVVDEDAKEQ